MNEKVNNRKIDYNSTILNALKKMDESSVKLLIVFKEDVFFGLLSIGDIQRAIINKTSLDEQIKNILRKEFTYAKNTDNFEDIKKLMLHFRTECMPVLDSKGNLVNVYFWDDLFSSSIHTNNKPLNLPVVIMAGGKGERLKPLTNIIPKPLIPIGEKTIAETIMEKFINAGCNNFYMSVNYKADTIKHYFDATETKYSIEYFEETKPLGTIGSVYLLKNKVTSSFFVSNCDIIIDQDLHDVYDYHINNKNELTIVAALKHYQIPYGVIETEADGIMTNLSEKPELTFMINSGMYILEPHLINEIPEDTFFHITHLIENIKKRNGKIGVFPVTESSWFDIGEWKEYLTTIKKL